MNSTKADHTRMMIMLGIGPEISEMPKECSPMEADLIEELQMLLEQMQCLGYVGARGVEHHLCAVCDEILSRLPTTKLLDAVPWCAAPVQVCTRANDTTQVWRRCT